MSSEKKKTIKIQRGFIAGIIAVCAISIASAFIIKNINDVDASVLFGSSQTNQLTQQGLNYSTNLNRCINSGVSQTESQEVSLTESEKKTYGAKAKAYNIKINKKKASFRLVVAAREGSSQLGSNVTEISYGLTFKSFENKNAWGGNNDRMIFIVTNGDIKADIYNKINKNETHTGSFKTTYNGTSNIRMHVEFQGKNYDGCIASVLVLPRDYQMAEPKPSPTATITSTTISSSPTATATVSSTTNLVSVTLKPGFNAFSLPADKKILSTKGLDKQGVTVWTFNRHGDKSWYTTGSSVQSIFHWVGYYIYNPDTTTKTVQLPISSSQEEGGKYIVKGWNLMSNPNSQAKPLTDIEFNLTPCPPAADGQLTCKSTGTNVKLSDLFIGDRWTQQAYPVMFVVDDPYTTDPDKAFSEIVVTEENRETVKIPANKMFWIYIWPE